MSLSRAIGQTHDIIHFQPGLDPAQLDPLLTYVYGEDLFGEDLAGIVGSENSHGNSGFLAGLSAFTHKSDPTHS